MLSRRARRWITWGLSIGLVLGIAGFVTATWIEAGSIAGTWLDREVAPAGPDAEVASVGPGTITLRAGSDLDRPGRWGLVFAGGRAIVDEPIAVTNDGVERVLVEFSGALTPGTPVEFDAAVWGIDFGPTLGFTETLVAVDGLTYPLWSAGGADDTWVVFVHGHRSTPAQSWRGAAAAVAAGYPTMVTSYRGDEATDELVRHGFGYDEWRDLEEALDVAYARGAGDVVLVGHGSGASVIGAYLAESRRSDRVIGVVLDAPLLDLGGLVAEEWLESGIPAWAIGWTKALASMRFGIDFGVLDHLEAAEQWPPLLILHGRNDAVAPLADSEQLALSRGPEALLLTFPEAGHGWSWNVDPARYEAAVIGFLDDIAAGPGRFPSDGG
jgi:pimeloyl-ACP methyl ester carboxylesterase